MDPVSPAARPTREPIFSLHKLRVFREVAERQSATSAARALFISQPVVSGHIRDLEQIFGAQLFFRTGRRMVLTEPGRTVLEYSEEVARQTAQTMTLVRLQQNGRAGRVRIGASETPGCYRLPEWLGDFRLHHESAAISMEVRGSAEICGRVAQGHYDFAIVAPIDPPPDVRMEVFYEEPLLLVCSPHHSLAHGHVVDQETIARQAFIAHSDRPDEWIRGRARLFGVENPRVSLSVSTTEATKVAVRTGVGIAAMFRCSVAHDLKRGDLVEIQLGRPPPLRPVYLVYSATKRFSPMQLRLLEYLRQRAQIDQPAVGGNEGQLSSVRWQDPVDLPAAFDR